MLYDGIAAESAHVSIDGRATASIIDEKKLPEWAASEAVFCQVSQLGEAGAGHSRTLWHSSYAAFSCVLKRGSVVGDHPPPVIQMSARFGQDRKRADMRLRSSTRRKHMAEAGARLAFIQS